jgi:hypothetical protein
MIFVRVVVVRNIRSVVCSDSLKMIRNDIAVTSLFYSDLVGRLSSCPAGSQVENDYGIIIHHQDATWM